MNNPIFINPCISRYLYKNIAPLIVRIIETKNYFIIISGKLVSAILFCCNLRFLDIKKLSAICATFKFLLHVMNNTHSLYIIYLEKNIY